MVCVFWSRLFSFVDSFGLFEFEEVGKGVEWGFSGFRDFWCRYLVGGGEFFLELVSLG